jgi:DNA-directed RNA polymerase specialized sigma24 family protein
MESCAQIGSATRHGRGRPLILVEEAHFPAPHRVASNQRLDSTVPEADSTPACPEPELLHRLAAGDLDAFWSLWLAHQDFLFRLCCHQMQGRRADAQDALAGLPRVALQITNLRGWLGRVAANVCRDIHRENQCRRWGARMDDALLEEDAPLASCEADPGEALLLRELEDRLQRATAALPSGLREAAELLFLQDSTAEEVVQTLAITVANAYKRIQRAGALLTAGVQAYLSGADMTGSRLSYFPGAPDSDPAGADTGRNAPHWSAALHGRLRGARRAQSPKDSFLEGEMFSVLKSAFS